LKKGDFSWDLKVKKAFEKLKGAMSKVPILGLPNFNKAFILETDASDQE